jgi:glycosyltransferase involved in cell wall biosynthesis
MKDKIVILMATYNGEKYVSAQIKSILEQTYNNFDLIIRDDGSTDKTISIIKSIIERNDKKNIYLLKNKSSKHGQLKNFANLFNYAKDKYKYIMFSDQDDIWYKNKIQISLDAIKKKGDTPTLIYTNYINWNMKDKTKNIAYSYIPECTFERLFVQNWTMGCTYLLNKGMIKQIENIPDGVDNHDYWIALVSSLNNNIEYLPQVTMEHRLHANNVTGRENSKSFKNRAIRLYTELINRSGRNKVYKRWCKIYFYLNNRYKNKSIVNLSQVLFSSNLKSIYLSYKYDYKAVTKKYDFVFRLYLLFKSQRKMEMLRKEK